MDITYRFERYIAGPNPAGDTKEAEKVHALVVQRIEHSSTKRKMLVRFQPRVPNERNCVDVYGTNILFRLYWTHNFYFESYKSLLR